MFGHRLETKRLVLAPPNEGAAKRFCQWFADLEVIRYLTRELPFQFPPSLSGEQEWLDDRADNGESIFWCIYALSGQKRLRHIGAIELSNIDVWNRRAEIGYAIGDKSCWGKGYAAEALAAVLSYGFESFGLEKIWLYVLEPNAASKRVAEKAGFSEWQVRRHHFYHSGQWLDAYYAEILREEWLQRQGSND